jgi:TolB-like protein
MLYRIFAITILTLMLVGVAAAQEKTVVFEFEGIGVDPATVEAGTHIFSSELNATGKFSVIPWGDVEAKLTEQGVTSFDCYQISCAANNGFIVGAQKAVIGTLTKLGDRITIDASLVDVGAKDVIFSDRFSATSMDDLDVALRKVAQALANQKHIESEVNPYAITEEETQESRRRKGYITSGASFGFGFPLGNSYSKVDDLFSLAWVMRYEAGSYVLDNSLGFSQGSGGEKDTTYLGEIINTTEVGIFFWDIGMRYILNRQSDFTPFFGGGIGLHFIGAQESEGYTYTEATRAFALHLAGGLYAFQSYDFRLTLEAKYTMLFSDVFVDSGSSSHQIGFSIGITRKFEKDEKRGCMSGGCMF